MSDYDELYKLYDEIDVLINKQVTTSSPDFITWHTKLDQFLLEKYGESSKAYKKFAERSFKPIVISPVMTAFLLASPNSFTEACQRDLKITKAELFAYLERIKEEEEAKLEINAPQEKSKSVVATFLIGNGFDLACGLKSKYKDTYKGYTGSPSSSDVIKSFKDNIEEDIETWADFEMAIAEHAKDFCDAEKLEECITDYQSYLNNYLKQEQEKFYKYCRTYGKDKLIDATMSLLSCKFYKDMLPNSKNAISAILETGRQKIFQCISFNYTKVFDELEEEAFSSIQSWNYPSKDTNKPIIHIHGELDNNPILGVDNKSQLGTLPYNLDSQKERSVVKSAFLMEFDKKKRNAALSYIQSSDIICAFGLSLGESDLTWREAVSAWLLDTPKHHLVFFKHDLADRNYSKMNSNPRMNDEETARWQLIILFFGKNITKEMFLQLDQQIHVPAGINIFKDVVLNR